MTMHASTKVEFRVDSLYDDPLTLDALLVATSFVDTTINSYLSQELVKAGEPTVSVDNVSSVVTEICDPGWQLVEGFRRQFNSCVSIETTIETSTREQQRRHKYLDYLVVTLLRRAVDLVDYPSTFGAEVSWLGPNLASAPLDVRLTARKELRIMNMAEQRFFHHAMRLALEESHSLQETASSVDLILLYHQRLITGGDDYSHNSDDVRKTRETTDSVQHLEVQALFLGRNPTDGSLRLFQDAIISSIREQSFGFLESLESVDGSLFESIDSVEAYAATETDMSPSSLKRPTKDLFQPVVYRELDFFDTTKAALALGFLAISIVVGGLLVIYLKKCNRHQTPQVQQQKEQIVTEKSDRTFLIPMSTSDISAHVVEEQVESNVRYCEFSRAE